MRHAAAAGLSALSADAARQLDVFGHDGDSLGVDGAQVGVLKQTDQISLAGLLQGHDSGALEAQVRLEILRDFSHQALERQFADQQLGGLLITADLSESHGPGPVTVGLLDAAGGWGALPGGFSSELLPRGFATGGFTSRLLGSCHRKDQLLSPSVENIPLSVPRLLLKYLTATRLWCHEGADAFDWLMCDVC